MRGSLRSQLFLCISAAFLLIMTGVEFIQIRTMRHTIEEQLERSTQEAATSLGLSLGVLLTAGDRALAETVINPVFDRGFYARIELIGTDGVAIIDRQLPLVDAGVPDWFAALLPFEAPAASSLVTAGWKQIGSVRVTGNPRTAYGELWHTTVDSLIWLAVWYILAILFAIAFLRRVLLPLEDIERVAVAIGRREFHVKAPVPRARELRHVAESINALSDKVRQAIEAEVARAESLRREAYQDTLTGLPNRRGFATNFQVSMRDARDVYRGAFVLLQLYEFDEYNHAAGYAKGDALLDAVGAVVTARSALLKGRSGRWSGTAFVVALPNVSEAEAGRFAHGLADDVTGVMAEHGCADEIRFAVGVVAFDGPAPELTHLLSAADTAAGQAAEQGSGVVVLEHGASVEEAIGSAAWRERLDRAIVNGSFELWIQPVLSLPGREPMQREIIARLHDDQGEPVTAGAFFPMAVRHGMAVQIDALLVERIIHRMESDQQTGEIAANVSADAVHDAEFVRWLEARLRAAPAVAKRLVFEVSESGSARDREAVQEFAGVVRRAGARFALDNFGLHPESLQLMRALLPAYVKLSRAHTAELQTDEASRFFVASLVRLGAPLDVRVIAQGVESESVLPLLADAGVAGFQGYFAAPPAEWTN